MNRQISNKSRVEEEKSRRNIKQYKNTQFEIQILPRASISTKTDIGSVLGTGTNGQEPVAPRIRPPLFGTFRTCYIDFVLFYNRDKRVCIY